MCDGCVCVCVCVMGGRNHGSVEGLLAPGAYQPDSHLAFIGVRSVLLGCLVNLWHGLRLQDLGVEQGGSHAPQHRSHPVYPMRRPDVGGKGGAHGASGIHAGPGVADGAQVTQGHRHSDGQGRRVAGIGLVGITGPKDDEHQQESQEELDSQALQLGDIGRQRGVTQAIVIVLIDENLMGWYTKNIYI